MKFAINGKELDLHFGVKFVAGLDKEEQMDAGNGIVFGMGTMLNRQKLKFGNLEALALIIQHALHGNDYSLNDVYEALDEVEDLDELFDRVEEELKNSRAAQVAETRMEKMKQEMSRQEQAKKHTKK